MYILILGAVCKVCFPFHCDLMSIFAQTLYHCHRRFFFLPTHSCFPTVMLNVPQSVNKLGFQQFCQQLADNKIFPRNIPKFFFFLVPETKCFKLLYINIEGGQ